MGATVFAPGADCDPLLAPEVDTLVQQAAKDQNLDEQVLRGVIATADQFGVPDPFDPKDNVEAGAAFLKQLLARYGGDLTVNIPRQSRGLYDLGRSKRPRVAVAAR
jgi:hypothetical protein